MPGWEQDVTAQLSGAPADDDKMLVRDKSDTTDSADGTDKDIRIDDLFTTPTLRGSNGNEALIFGGASSAVNHVQVDNAASGNRPVVAAVGGDSTIGLRLQAKSGGKIVARGGSGSGVSETGSSVLIVDGDGASTVDINAPSGSTVGFKLNNGTTNAGLVQHTGGALEVGTFADSSDDLKLYVGAGTEALLLDRNRRVTLSSNTSQPGTANSPILQMGNGGAGFYIDSSGEIVAVDEAGNTTQIT